MANQYDIDPVRDEEIFFAAQDAGSAYALSKAGVYGGKYGILSAIRRHKQRMSGARPLHGMEVRTVTDQYAADGTLKGYSVTQTAAGDVPLESAIPGNIVKRISTNYRADGTIGQRWVIEAPEMARVKEAMEVAAAALAADIPSVPAIQPPLSSNKELLNLYIFTDYHVGMLAWHREGGEDWDLAVAETLLVSAFADMIAKSPDAQTAIVGQLGDFLHTDSFKPLTPASGHLLDADSRFPKMIEVAVRVLRRIVTMALEKHEKVIVLMAEGNHDESSSAWLRVLFKALFDENPRVIVEDSPLPFYAYQHGEVMLAFHHGHKVKMDALPALFAQQFREMWGATKKSYGHSGHYHHEVIKEYSGIKWTQHPTLSARDAYAARGGYHAERATNVITYHKKYGQVQTITVKPEMFHVG